ncbi:hypothetical protein OE88DRAFT_1664774 [Heliocybe sulcata]|uniref:Cleavage/polyadenylation specificity factor A subunit N-terminal domain-containing protein n=1 Tax=Heliocybe sulcata TaxID=5364 RepID=A0A5C3MTL0_9AGAM|nr:hypothetical protein OE88DRAFT_1664774 [Heliocybe sulcata]
MPPSLLHATHVLHEGPPGADTDHPSTGKALVSIHTHPYLLTLDIGGEVTRLWSVESSEPTLINTLKPSLPSNFCYGIVHSIATRLPQLLVAGYCSADRQGALVRIYNRETGELLRDIDVPVSPAHGWPQFMYREDLLAMLVNSHPPEVILYRQSSDDLEEIRKVPCAEDADYALLHIITHDFLLTAHSFIPGDFLTITMHPLSQGASNSINLLAFGRRPGWADPDMIAVEQVEVISTDKIALSVTESWDYSYEETTVYVLELPSLRVTWRTHLTLESAAVSCHPSLGTLVVISKPIRDSVSDTYTTHVLFLNLEDGSIVREESFGHGGAHVIAAECTASGLLVVVADTGALSVTPVEDILKSGLRCKDDGGIIVMRDIDIHPLAEGFISHWVEYARVISTGVLLFPRTGQDIYFVKW